MGDEVSGNDETNGNDWRERMDRVERGLEHLLKVSAEHEAAIGHLIILQQRSDEHINRTLDIVERVAEEHRETRRETDERLNALIRIVDDLVRRPPAPPQG